MTAKHDKDGGKEQKAAAQEQIQENMRSALGTVSTERAMHLANQVASNTRAFVKGGEGRVDAMAAIFESIASLAPKDETERMLIAQMISVNEAAMECFARAMLPDQTFAGRDMNLKHAEKLAGIYTRQLEALDKHRGKGKQKITVEHVNVHAGGQAIVGDVHATNGGPTVPSGTSGADAAQLADQSDANAEVRQIMEELDRAKTAAKRRKQV